MFICFDIMFGIPSLKLVKLGIKNFVFSSMWINWSPFMSAVQMQQAFSKRFGINLLASNIGNGKDYSGSGIYQNGEPLIYFFNPTREKQNKLLITTIEEEESKSTKEEFINKKLIKEKLIKEEFINEELINEESKEKSKEEKLIKEKSKEKEKLMKEKLKKESSIYTFKSFKVYPGMKGNFQIQVPFVQCNLSFQIR